MKNRTSHVGHKAMEKALADNCAFRRWNSTSHLINCTPYFFIVPIIKKIAPFPPIIVPFVSNNLHQKKKEGHPTDTLLPFNQINPYDEPHSGSDRFQAPASAHDQHPALRG